MVQPSTVTYIHEFSPELKIGPSEIAKIKKDKTTQLAKKSGFISNKTVFVKDLKDQTLELPKKVNKFLWIITSIFKEPSRTIDEDTKYDSLLKQINSVKENFKQIQIDIENTKQQIKDYSNSNASGDINMKNELIQSLVARRKEWKGAKAKLDKLVSSVKETRFVNYHADLIEEISSLEKKLDVQFKDLSHMGNDLNLLNQIESKVSEILRQRYVENELAIMIGDSRGSLTPHLENLAGMAEELDKLIKRHGNDEYIKNRLTNEKQDIIKLVTKGIIEELDVGDVEDNVPYAAVRLLMLDSGKKISRGKNNTDYFNNLTREFKKIAYLSQVSQKMDENEKDGMGSYTQDRLILMQSLSGRMKELLDLEDKARSAKEQGLLKKIQDYKKEILKDHPDWDKVQYEV